MLKLPTAHATIVAYLALFVALGGVAWAAQLPRNSVSTAQLRSNAVTSPKVRNGTLRLADLAPATRKALRGQKGATGAAGATGATGATGPAGLAAWETIPSGTTVTGAVIHVGRRVAGETVSESVALPARAPVALTNETVNFAPANQVGQEVFLGDADPACTGDSETPTAPPGKVCLYLRDGVPNVADASLIGASFYGDSSLVERTGFRFAYTGPAVSGQVIVRFGWAYTAP